MADIPVKCAVYLFPLITHFFIFGTMANIIVHTKLLANIPDYSQLSKTTLRRRMNEIRDFANKEKRQPVTVFDLAKFLGIEASQVKKMLYPEQK